MTTRPPRPSLPRPAPTSTSACPAPQAAPSTPQGGGPGLFLQLQRTAGNRAVAALLGRRGAVDPQAAHEVALAGFSEPGTALPHREAIERAFGPDLDLRHVVAHVGGAAATATAALGAAAYTRGAHIAFREPPDLHLAAHEAAHVVQQRSGVDLPAAIGESGDRYEQQADAVAARVVAGGWVGSALGGEGAAPGATRLPISRPATVHSAIQLAPAVPGPRPAPALSAKAAFQAYESARLEGLNPLWIATLEDALGLEVTMSPSPELAVAFAELEVAAGRRPSGLLDPTNRSWLEQELPQLAEISDLPDTAEAPLAEGLGSDPRAPLDEALRGLHLGSYADYVKTFVAGSFLGYPVTVRPEMLARLQVAEAYLRQTFCSTPQEIAQQLGIYQVESFRSSTATSDQMHHATGFAIDINKDANDYNFGNSAQRHTFQRILTDVALLFGVETIDSATELGSIPARSRTTEQIFDQVEQSNLLLRRYRGLAADPAALAAYLDSPECPARAKRIGAAGWAKRMERDEATLQHRTRENPTQPGPAGFMDLAKELVVALRDVGGLRWGAVDFGCVYSGDMMHFDGHHIPLARRIAARKDAVMAQRGL